MIDLKMLRRLAEEKPLFYGHNNMVSLPAKDLLQLLDHIEMIEKLCEANHKAYIEAVTR